MVSRGEVVRARGTEPSLAKSDGAPKTEPAAAAAVDEGALLLNLASAPGAADNKDLVPVSPPSCNPPDPEPRGGGVTEPDPARPNGLPEAVTVPEKNTCCTSLHTSLYISISIYV